jgi:uroporphyrinogen III methyltransferase / synthase
MTRLLVTRPGHQAEPLVAALGRHGIDAVAVPTVATLPTTTSDTLDEALRSLAGTDWLIITSVNGASALLARLAALQLSLPQETRLAAVGPATAGALRAGGLRVDHVPTEFLTVAIADGLGDLVGRRVVLARADAATPELARSLRARGALVHEVVAYRTVEGPSASRDRLHAVLRDGVDGVTFTSGSTVRGLMRLVTGEERRRLSALPAYCIGPVTARAAEAAGFSVPVVAEPHTASALASAIAAHLAKEPA